MTSSRCLKWLSGLMLAVSYLECATPHGQAAITPDFLSNSDPEIREPEPVQKFNPALKELWIAALNRPEIDMQRMAAETIARGHKFGVPELRQAVPRLEEILLANSSHETARFASARALIALESRDSAPKLFDASQQFGDDLRQLIEPTLADWKFSPIRDVWSKRLETSTTRRRDLLLAIRGLAIAREQASLPRLFSMIEDTTIDPDLRLEAATAAGQIAESSLAEKAGQLAKAPRAKGFISHLCAVRLLAGDQSDNARTLLIGLAADAEPAVAAASLRRLNEIDTALVVPLADNAMKHPDPRVRGEGAKAYLAHPTVERIAPLAQLIADPHPQVRRAVSEGLAGLAKQPELTGTIQETATQILQGDRWQGQEQAALLFGRLEYQPVANRLVELLESPRPEVMVATAWALRKVAVKETSPALIDKARRQTDRQLHPPAPGSEEQVMHLFEALTVLKATEAIPLLSEYFPKPDPAEYRERPRGTAIWAIGKLLEGQPNAEIAETFNTRINDFAERNPERDTIKAKCAVALARMKEVDQVPLLKGMATTESLPLHLRLAMRWAVKELTGEELPTPEPLTASQGTWFLQPLP